MEPYVKYHKTRPHGLGLIESQTQRGWCAFGFRLAALARPCSEEIIEEIIW